MRTISRNKILLNAYSSNDLTVSSTGKLAIASTPVSIIWKKLFGHKKESYAAGSYATIAIDFSGITAVSNGPHRVELRNNNTQAIQRKIERVVYGDASATAAEIGQAFADQFQEQSGPNSLFEYVSYNTSTKVLTIRLNDTTYSAISLVSDITGIASTVTAAVEPIGSTDAATVSGYNPAVQYDKFTFQEEGTINEDGRDIPVLFEDVVYVETSLTAFTTDYNASVKNVTDITDATVRPYEAVDELS